MIPLTVSTYVPKSISPSACVGLPVIGRSIFILCLVVFLFIFRWWFLLFTFVCFYFSISCFVASSLLLDHHRRRRCCSWLCYALWLCVAPAIQVDWHFNCLLCQWVSLSFSLTHSYAHIHSIHLLTLCQSHLFRSASLPFSGFWFNGKYVIESKH